MSSERERVREKTNMIPGECCNAACWDTCLATMFFLLGLTDGCAHSTDSRTGTDEAGAAGVVRARW